MRSRLERAERAIEQERAANRNLEAALQSAQQVSFLDSEQHQYWAALSVPLTHASRCLVQRKPLAGIWQSFPPR